MRAQGGLAIPSDYDSLSRFAVRLAAFRPAGTCLVVVLVLTGALVLLALTVALVSLAGWPGASD